MILKSDQGIKSSAFAVIGKLNLNYLITIHGPAEDILVFLKSCHAEILSSNSERLSVALLRYRFVGLLVACINVGDCAKVISTYEFGFLIPLRICRR